MFKRIPAILLVSLVNICVLASITVPHHHHENSTIACFCSEDNSHECGCDAGHHKGESEDCCSVKQNFVAHTSGGVFQLFIEENRVVIQDLYPVEISVNFLYSDIYNDAENYALPSLRAPPMYV